ncbi:response regulator transcription factor [Proteiniborus sp. MB09-C3]|uniref:response regulator transcription factor n=1 Tax=Proteiniborus sp. MB09-C3 TaxID=3050072 RepID=UPI002555203B|nr:response regulator transcription factor [Proteiniborus sp. MB09-C3]WIV13758.1 response regulator transcription factor [Proteiniborus sp. MB09-C3]
MQKILIVEDDISIQELLHDYIQEAGFEVYLASDGVEAVTLFSTHNFELVLLDIMLPKIDGYSVCEIIRKRSNIPIIFLTAMDSENDQIKGFDLLADDYVTKPFSMPVLMRKLTAVLRRTSANDKDSQFIKYKNLQLDVDAYKAYVDGNNIELTPREFEILRELLSHQGRILTRDNLINLLWKYDFYGDERIVDTHIKNLRKKLDIDLIDTIRGVGYRIDKEI